MCNSVMPSGFFWIQRRERGQSSNHVNNEWRKTQRDKPEPSFYVDSTIKIPLKLRSVKLTFPPLAEVKLTYDGLMRNVP